MGRASQPDDLLAALIGDRLSHPFDFAHAGSLPPAAAKHGLSPLVLDRIDAGALWVPGAVRNAIADDAARARRLQAMLDLEVRRLAGRVPNALSTPLILKGPAVARRYPDPELRPYVDIDLLVPEAELDDWREPLETLGYEAPDKAEATLARLTHHHLVFRRGAIHLELHWRLFAAREARALDHAALRTHAAPDANLGGLLVMTAPAQLVVLAVHLAHHRPGTRKLVWLLDFLTLGEEGTVQQARALAEGWGVAWALEGALADTEGLLGEARWGARSERVGGLVAARGREAGQWGTRVAKARAIGPRKTWRYLIERIRTRGKRR